MSTFPAVLVLGLLACQCVPGLGEQLSPDLEPLEGKPTATLTFLEEASTLAAAGTPSATPVDSRVSVSGRFDTVLETLLDIAEHFGFIGLPGKMDIDVRQSDITFDGPDPFVDVVGVWNENGSFDARGSGAVAGFPDVTVRMVGMITYERYEAYYIMGTGGELPQGMSITFRAQGVRKPEDGTQIGPVVPEDLDAFLADFVPAIQSNDQVFLFARLNPEVVARYGPEGCTAYLSTREPDPTYAVVVTSVEGPGLWDYTSDERTTTIENMLTVHASVTSVGETTDRELHFAQPGAFLTWLTDCGEPVQ